MHIRKDFVCLVKILHLKNNVNILHLQTRVLHRRQACLSCLTVCLVKKKEEKEKERKRESARAKERIAKSARAKKSSLHRPSLALIIRSFACFQTSTNSVAQERFAYMAIPDLLTIQNAFLSRICGEIDQTVTRFL